VESFSLVDEKVTFTVNNLGRASTQNATLQYVDGNKILWESDNFTANASSTTTITSDGFDFEDGEWRLSYQKRVVHSSQWVNESVDVGNYEVGFFAQSLETLVWALQAGAIPLFVIGFAFWWSREEKPFDLEEIPLEAEILD